MLTATAQEHSARTFSRTSVDTWEATRRDRFLADTPLYPRNLLFIEELCTIPVFCSIATQTPYMSAMVGGAGVPAVSISPHRVSSSATTSKAAAATVAIHAVRIRSKYGPTSSGWCWPRW